MIELKLQGAIPSVYRFENSRIRVEWRDGRERHDLWAITDGGACLAKDGEWEYEPLPSSRTDEYIERCRYPLDEALRLAAIEIQKGKR